ncbi:hypothetical protein [Sphingomonas sp.]|uniref:hypothetical protein n=1 Tax=Sphingomonas sp. TaxID=28214 RepID=UPI003B3ABB95
MSNPLSTLAMRLHQAVMEPALVMMRRASRLRAFGMNDDERAETLVAWHRPRDCRAPCPLHPTKVPKLLRRYAAPSYPLGDRAARTRLTPMAIELDQLHDVVGFERMLKARSSRTLSKIRRAQRMGYSARQFMLAQHVHDLHAIKTSMAFRAAGPVIDRWLLKPHHICRPASVPLAVAAPCCPVHWTIWWGVFAPEPGHRQGGVETAERLVAYVKLMRVGDVIHYTEIMGHRERLADGVMLLLHHQIVRWLIDAPEPAAKGARILLYGAAEHGGAGLLTWKKRAGFRPVKLRLA